MGRWPTWIGSHLARGDEERDGENGLSTMTFYVTSFVAQMVFGVAASLVVMAFSRRPRWRERASRRRIERLTEGVGSTRQRVKPTVT